MLTRKNLLWKLIIVICIIVAGVITGLVVMQVCGVSNAEAKEMHREITPRIVEAFNFDAAIKKARSEETAKRVTKKQPSIIEIPRRKIRTYTWESSATSRAKLLMVLPEDHDTATLIAFLRVCIAEADGNPSDCIGIWQVIKNNRRQTCARTAPGGRRITECDVDGETFLSSLRRHQRHILGYIPLRNRRATWISKMDLDCDNPPDEYQSKLPEDERLNLWDSRYQKRCQQTIMLGYHLMKNELPPSKPGHRYNWLPGRPITWGGRCESKKASCDDAMACSRGLRRIDSDTFNAFWRKRLPDEGPDPICIKLGYS